MQRFEQVLRYIGIAITVAFLFLLLIGLNDIGVGFVLLALTALAFFLFLIWVPIHVLLSVKHLNVARSESERAYLRIKLKIIFCYPLLIGLLLVLHFLVIGSRATVFGFLPVFVVATFVYVLFVVMASLTLKRVYKVGQLSDLQEQPMKWYKAVIYTFLALYFLYLIPALFSHYRYAHTFENPPSLRQVIVPFF